MSEKKFINLSGQYYLDSLTEEQLAQNPFDQFKKWFHEVKEKGMDYPEAMNIATVNAEGQISSRIVLMKTIEEDGIVFFTNYDSHKGKDLAFNPNIAANFFWAGMERQVRIEGVVEKTTREESQAYFDTRPRGSQMGAWISKQSDTVTTREEMETTFADFEKEHEGKDLEVPPFWGGYKIKIQKFEFWQGRPSRLHDRLVYDLVDDNWEIKRLWP
jgi:pyridoxamine 5'-phosphate oxidase